MYLILLLIQAMKKKLSTICTTSSDAQKLPALKYYDLCLVLSQLSIP